MASRVATLLLQKGVQMLRFCLGRILFIVIYLYLFALMMNFEGLEISQNEVLDQACHRCKYAPTDIHIVLLSGYRACQVGTVG